MGLDETLREKVELKKRRGPRTESSGAPTFRVSSKKEEESA